MSLASLLPYDHAFAGGYPGIGSQPLPTDSDCLTYLAAVKAADGAGVETGVAVAVDAFFRDTKAAGVFSALKACCILAGARTLAGALVPVVGDAPTNNNFTASDYDRFAGLKGDGSTTYLNTNRDGDDDPQNDFHMSYFVASSINAFDIAMGAGGASTGSTQIQGGQYRCRNGSGDNMDAHGGNLSGFVGMSRSSSSEYIGRDNGTTTTYTRSSQSPFTGNLLVYARESGGNPGLFSDMRIAFYSIGESVDLEALETSVSSLVTAIGNL